MAREVEMGTGYPLVVEIARRIEGYRQRGREQMQQDKRTHFSGEFRGAPARGKANQGSSSANFSAMSESSYHPPVIRGSSSGYSGHQGQTLGQQSMVPRGCYECGNLGHVKRTYPRLRVKAVQQGHQPMIAAPAVRPPRGGGQAGRGHPRGGGQAGEGQPAIVHPGGGQSAGASAKFYTFLARPDAVASDAVITCIISICGRYSSVLFYPGSTYSYVSSMFAHFLDIPRESLGTSAYVSTPLGDSVVVEWIYRSGVVTFCGYETTEGLLLLDMTEFEFILGMDWLSLYHAILDCHSKIVTLTMLDWLDWSGRVRLSPGGARAAFESSAPDIARIEVEGRVITYASRQLKLHEKNYPVHDLVLVAIVHDLKIWRHYLYGVPCEVYTNHRSLQHLFKQRDLNMRQCIWLELLKDYNITILYHSGKANVKLIQERLRTAQSIQKSYADQKARDVSFMVGENVLFKVSPMKGIMRFGKKGKLSPRFIGSFEVLRRVGEVAYELSLPPSLSAVHPVFHVSMLRRYHVDLSHVLDFITIQQDESLGYEEEPVAIVARQDHQLRSKRISMVKVQWRGQPVEKAT
ncbi:uncharacterized protein [Nicotiana tomentosiformis]|uniref:uncharacterized protein n=1 Tax=Nicotiana tomentosiformis TaxID=4098 RepID=UPI00388C5FB2